MTKRFLVFFGFLVFGLFSLPQTSNAASVWISGQPSCASGPYSITVNWDVAPDPTWGYFVDVTPDSSFGTFWNKQVSGGLRSISAISGFGSSQFGESAPSGPVQLNPGTTYYARVWSGTHYPNSSPGVSFNVPACATPTPTPAPSQPTISGLPACSSGAYNATISWTGTPNLSYGFYVDVDDSDPNFGSFYNKSVGSVFSTAVSNFLGLYPSQNQTLALQPGITYYTRVFNGQHSTANSFSVPVCATPTPTITPIPTPAPSQINVSGSCSGSNYIATINWSGVPGSGYGFYVDISTSDGFPHPFWNKNVSESTYSTQVPSGFSVYPLGSNLSSLVLNPGIYYVRVFNGQHSVPTAFVVPVCSTPTPTPAPSQPTISGLPACSSGTYNATISWTGTPNPSYGFYVDVDDSDPNFGSFYNKNVGSVFSTAVSNFLGLYPSQNQTLALQPGTTYYARVFNGQHSTANSFSVPVCATPTPTPVSTPTIAPTPTPTVTFTPTPIVTPPILTPQQKGWHYGGLDIIFEWQYHWVRSSDGYWTIFSVGETSSFGSALLVITGTPSGTITTNVYSGTINTSSTGFNVTFTGSGVSYKGSEEVGGDRVIITAPGFSFNGLFVGKKLFSHGDVQVSQSVVSPDYYSQLMSVSGNMSIGPHSVILNQDLSENDHQYGQSLTSSSIASNKFSASVSSNGTALNHDWVFANMGQLTVVVSILRNPSNVSQYFANYALVQFGGENVQKVSDPVATILETYDDGFSKKIQITSASANLNLIIDIPRSSSAIMGNIMQEDGGAIATANFRNVSYSGFAIKESTNRYFGVPAPIPGPGSSVGTAPGQPSISGSCSNGAYNANISWSGTPNTYGFYVDISTNAGFPYPFWNKNLADNVSRGSYSIQAPSGFGYYPADQPLPTLILNPGTYYARVFNGQHGATATFSVPSCGTSSSRATFVTTDSSTQGNWKNIYGNEGAVVFNDNTNISNFTVTPRGNSSWTWSGNTLDARAPEKTSSSGRIAATIFSARTFTVDVAPKDSNSHRMALYFLDWDYKSRAETVEILDLATGAVLDSRAINNFSGGKYLVYDISGNIQIRLTLQGGDNAVLSGVFFSGSSSPPPPPPPAGTAPSQPSVTGSCSSGTYNTSISWSGTPNIYGFYVDISTNVAFPHPFWNKNIPGGPYSTHSTQAPSGFGYYPANQPLPTLILNPGTYYARVFNGQHSPATAFSVPSCGGSTSGYDFDTANNEFVLTNKTAMDPFQGKGIWLSNERIKVYRNVHGSNWSPIKPYSFLTANSAYTLDPLSKLMPTNVGSGVVYVNDGSSYWSNNPFQPGINEDKFESRVGLGYTKEGITYKNLETSVTYFVPSYNQSEPVIVQLVNVKNIGPIGKTFKFFSYHDMIPDGTASFDTTTKSLIIAGATNMFLTSTIDMTNYDSSRASFLGAGADGNPQAVVSGSLKNSLTSSDDILAGQVDIYLKPGESHEFAFVVGTYKNPTEKNNLISKYKNINNVKSILGSTKNFYKTKTDNIPGLSSRTAKLQTQLRILGYSALSTSMFWDPFVDKLTLNQMGIYNETVNARDTAQIALGLMYMDPILSRQGLESFLESAQYSNGRMPYGLNIFSDGYRSKPDNSPPPSGKWGSDNIGWMTFAVCSYVNTTNDTSWLNKNIQYRDSTIDSVYGHTLRALNYDYTNNINPNGLLNTQGGDWIDHFHGSDLIDGESVYSSALLYAATQKCLPYMTAGDRSLYSQRANNLKSAIENNAYDSASGRYARLITTGGTTGGSKIKIGSSQDGRVFSDMAVIGLTSDFNTQGVKNTILASYNMNQGSGNLIYSPSYTTNEESRLGLYSRPNWLFDNKVWARVCGLVTVALKKQGLNNEAEDNFVKCLPDRWTSDKYASPFNYIEIYDPRGDTQVAGAGFKLSEWSFSDADDDAMAIWAQAQLGGGQLAQADLSSSSTGSWGFAKNIFSNIFSTISSSFGSFRLF